MMWIVYNTKTAEIYKKCYSKAQGKDYIKYVLGTSWRDNRRAGLEKVNLMELDKWKTWAILKVPAEQL